MSATAPGASRRRRLLWLLVPALAALIGGVAGATTTGADVVYNGCYGPDGNLRIVQPSDSCKTNETAIVWSQRGPQGERGPQGIQGQKGDPGISAGYEVWKITPVEITAVAPDEQHVLTLSLPAGSYFVTSMVELRKADGGGVARCYAYAPIPGSPSNAAAFHRAAMGTDPGNVTQVTLSAGSLITFPEPNSVELRCSQRDGMTGSPFTVSVADLTAISIGSVVSQGAGS